jgi:hypothetical protein
MSQYSKQENSLLHIIAQAMKPDPTSHVIPSFQILPRSCINEFEGQRVLQS